MLAKMLGIKLSNLLDFLLGNMLGIKLGYILMLGNTCRVPPDWSRMLGNMVGNMILAG